MRSEAKPVTTTASLEPDGGEVAQRDVEDRAVAVHGQQRLGQLGGVLAEPASRARRQHHPDHSPFILQFVEFAGRRPAALEAPPRDGGLGHEHGARAGRPRRTSPPGARRAASSTQAMMTRPSQPAASAVQPARRDLGAVAQPVDEVVVAERQRGEQRERGRQRVADRGQPDQRRVLAEPHAAAARPSGSSPSAGARSSCPSSAAARPRPRRRARARRRCRRTPPARGSRRRRAAAAPSRAPEAAVRATRPIASASGPSSR